MMHQEQIQTMEEMPYSSRIKLHFFRHDEKEKDNTKPDTDIRLTPAGRLHAKSTSKEVNLNQAMAFGSDRKRAQETAAFRTVGFRDEITGKETLEELKQKIDAEKKYGTGIAIDNRLNFEHDPESDYGKEALEAFKDGKLAKYLVEQSDKRVQELGDEKSFSYSRQASNIASIIDKYVSIANRWDDLANDPTKHYEKDLERFLGNHQVVGESFLAKVIEKIKGIAERDRFVESTGNKGFVYSEGYDVEIIIKEKGAEPVIKITYKKEKDGESVFEFNEEISIALLKEIENEKV